MKHVISPSDFWEEFYFMIFYSSRSLELLNYFSNSSMLIRQSQWIKWALGNNELLVGFTPH